MPQRPPRQCHHPGCPNLVTGRSSYCREHQRDRWRSQNMARPTPHAKGYDRAWRKLSAKVLEEEPICRACGAPATEVDHIVPRAWGGTDDRRNLQPLCKSCHSRKTMRELRAATSAAPVTVVAGPPGAGKTSFVRTHMSWGDLVVDYDAIMAALSFAPSHHHPANLRPFGEACRGILYRELALRLGSVRAWIIGVLPRKSTRTRLRKRFGARVVVLETDEAECLRRIRQADERNQDPAALARSIRRWWATYEQDDEDLRLPRWQLGEVVLPGIGGAKTLSGNTRSNAVPAPFQATAKSVGEVAKVPASAGESIQSVNGGAP